MPTLEQLQKEIKEIKKELKQLKQRLEEEPPTQDDLEAYKAFLEDKKYGRVVSMEDFRKKHGR